MTRQKIILASAHQYDPGIRLGTSYLAEGLAKRGWEALYLDQPTSPFHLASPAKRDTALRKLRRAVAARRGGHSVYEFDGGGSVKTLSVVSMLPHVNLGPFRSGVTLQNWWRASFPSVTAEITRLGFGSAPILFDSPVFFPLARAIGARSIYRYADRMSGFGEITGAMLDLQERVFEEADLVIHSARSLRDDIGGRSGPTLYLPNGVDLNAFAGETEEPTELAGLGGPRIVYSGAFGAWFDAPLVLAAARALPHAQFVLLGQVPRGGFALEGQANVHLLGERPFAGVARILRHCHAAIIPFDVKRMPSVVEAINPLKLYEYGAAGLPVVAYPSAEIRQAGGATTIYETAADFPILLAREIETDTEEKRRARRAWARGASWDVRAADLERAIQALPPRLSRSGPA